MKDVRTKLSKEECALGMGQRLNDAVAKDVRTLMSMEECALGMGQRSNDATPIKEDCAGGTGQIAYEESIALISALVVINSGLQFIITS